MCAKAPSPIGTFATARGGSLPVRSTISTVTLGTSSSAWKIARKKSHFHMPSRRSRPVSVAMTTTTMPTIAIVRSSPR